MYKNLALEQVEKGITSDLSQNRIEELLQQLVDKNEKLENEIDSVKERIGKVVTNSFETPFTTAYWKDSETKKIYFVEIKNGALTVTEDESIKQPGDKGNELEDLLEDRLLLWHDEFEGTEINNSLWQYGASLWGSYKQDDPVNTCVYVRDGKLHVECHPVDYSDITKGWYCGAVSSKRMIRRGHYQAKIKVLSTKYQNVAFWCNAPDPWPVTGEIDMLETSGDTKFQGALHYGKADGSNGANSSSTYPSTKEWFIAGVEIGDETIDLYVDNTYYKSMKITEGVSLFGGKSPFGQWATKLIFDVAADKASTHDDKYAIVTGIECEYVRAYAPKEALSDACDENNKQEITDLNIVYPLERNRPVTFVDKDGKTKIQTGCKFMMTIDTLPHTEDSAYTSLSSVASAGNATESNILDIYRYKGTPYGYGWYSKRAGTEIVKFKHVASGIEKLISFTTAQNYKDKVACDAFALEDVNIGEAKYWIHNDNEAAINKIETYGKFKAKPVTTYQLSISGGPLLSYYNSTYRCIKLEEYDLAGKKLVTTAFTSPNASITTKEKTAWVKLYCLYVDGSNFSRKDYWDMLGLVGFCSVKEALTESSDVVCKGIVIDKSDIIYDGTQEWITLEATTIPNETTQPVNWKSQAGFVVFENTLGKSVKVKGITMGYDTLTVSCGDYHANVSFTVSGIFTK